MLVSKFAYMSLKKLLTNGLNRQNFTIQNSDSICSHATFTCVFTSAVKAEKFYDKNSCD
jgi:hypothetical protein